MTRFPNLFIVVLISVIIMILSGCNNDSASSKNEQTPQITPSSPAGDAIADLKEDSELSYTGGAVELVVLDVNTAISQDQEIQDAVVQSVKEMYPDITLKIVKDSIDNMIIAGTPPDLVALSNTRIAEFQNLDYPTDLSPLIKHIDLDLSAIDPVVMEAIEGFGADEDILGIPFGMNHGALIYNQNLFDKFGVPYLDDNTTWQELIEINRTLTRQDETGTQHIGVATSSILNMTRQYGNSTFDDTNESVALNTEGHYHVLNIVKQLFEITGYVQDDQYLYKGPDFFDKQIVSVLGNWIAAIANDIKNYNPDFAWDISTFPVFEDKPNVGNPVDFHLLMVSDTSKHKEAAAYALKALVSQNAQTAISKAGRISILNNTEMKESFLQDSGIFDGKNLHSIFQISAAPLVQSDFSEHRGLVNPFFNDAVKQISLNELDINTALRQAEEKANQELTNARQ